MSDRRSLVLVALLALTQVAGRIDRLSETERIHYDALRVWMDDRQIKALLKLKTEEERNAWLKAQGFWDRYYQYDERTREQMRDGRVAEGWKQDMVFMTWGPPHERRRNALHTGPGRSELFIYRFEVTDDGRVLVWAPKSKETHNARDLYRIELVIDEGVVSEITRREGWE
jgi:hypothetical protein